MSSGKPGLTKERKAWLASLSTLAAGGPYEVALYHHSREQVSIVTVELQHDVRVRVVERNQRRYVGDPLRTRLEKISPSGEVEARSKRDGSYGWIEPLTDDVRLELQRRKTHSAIIAQLALLNRQYDLRPALKTFDDAVLGELLFMLTRVSAVALTERVKT